MSLQACVASYIYIGASLIHFPRPKGSFFAININLFVGYKHNFTPKMAEILFKSTAYIWSYTTRQGYLYWKKVVFCFYEWNASLCKMRISLMNDGRGYNGVFISRRMFNCHDSVPSLYKKNSIQSWNCALLLTGLSRSVYLMFKSEIWSDENRISPPKIQ